MEHFKIPSWLVRNPLGIVALFISLIYAMSATLLGAAVGSLTSETQTVLVYFIALFPPMVLCVFSWLVSCHHTKLYGPGDYRTDQAFLDAGRTVTTEEVANKLEKEIQSDSEKRVKETPPSERKREAPTPHDKLETLIFDGRYGKSWQLSKAYLAEGLVFQALQAEYRGSVRKDVSLGGVHVDGLLYDPAGSITVVEVKMVSNPHGLHRRIREAEHSLMRAHESLRGDGVRRANLLLALVVDGNATQVSAVKNSLALQKISFDARVYSLADLARQYGFESVFEFGREAQQSGRTVEKTGQESKTDDSS